MNGDCAMRELAPVQHVSAVAEALVERSRGGGCVG